MITVLLKCDYYTGPLAPDSCLAQGHRTPSLLYDKSAVGLSGRCGGMMHRT